MDKWISESNVLYLVNYSRVAFNHQHVSLNKHWKPGRGFHLERELLCTVEYLLTAKWLSTSYRIWGEQYAVITYYPSDTSDRNRELKRWLVTAPILFVKEWTPRFKQSKLFRTSPEKKQTILWQDSRFFIALWRTGEIWKRGFFPSVRRTVHTIPSRKRSFLKGLFKPEEFKSAGFRVRVTIKHLKTY